MPNISLWECTYTSLRLICGVLKQCSHITPFYKACKVRERVLNRKGMVFQEKRLTWLWREMTDLNCWGSMISTDNGPNPISHHTTTLKKVSAIHMQIKWLKSILHRICLTEANMFKHTDQVSPWIWRLMVWSVLGLLMGLTVSQYWWCQVCSYRQINCLLLSIRVRH